ncbi:MAG: flagellar assembly protein FliX [Xanthobacteraceae bacterium]
MRINGAMGLTSAPAGAATRRARPGEFSLPQADSDTAPNKATGPRGVAGIDALMALQGVDDPAERRRRSVTRGRTALDVLEELKLGVLVGKLDATTLGRLKMAATRLKDSSGDKNLDAVLAEIELRVEVELAKLGTRAGA